MATEAGLESSKPWTNYDLYATITLRKKNPALSTNHSLGVIVCIGPMWVYFMTPQ